MRPQNKTATLFCAFLNTAVHRLEDRYVRGFIAFRYIGADDKKRVGEVSEFFMLLTFNARMAAAALRYRGAVRVFLKAVQFMAVSAFHAVVRT